MILLLRGDQLNEQDERPVWNWSNRFFQVKCVQSKTFEVKFSRLVSQKSPLRPRQAVVLQTPLKRTPDVEFAAMEAREPWQPSR